MIEPNPHIAALAPYALADLTIPAGLPPVSLAQNESAFAPSPNLDAARNALVDARLYPDPDWTQLREAIARVHGIAPQAILCGAGSMELIACLMRCYAGPGAGVLSSRFGYAFFHAAASAMGAPYAWAAERDYTVCVEDLLAAVDHQTRIVCVANPGNPTGTRIPRQDLIRLRDHLDDNILLVVDEAYGEFADGDDDGTFDLVERGNTIILRTLSKAYGLAGLRVGWGAFPAPIRAEIRKVLNPNNVSAVSQAAATAAMDDQAFMRDVCTQTAARLDGFAHRVRKLGLRVPHSHTNIVLIEFPHSDAANKAECALRTEGILLRGMAGYGLPQGLRATIGTEEDMERATLLLAQLADTTQEDVR